MPAFPWRKHAAHLLVLGLHCIYVAIGTYGKLYILYRFWNGKEVERFVRRAEEDASDVRAMATMMVWSGVAVPCIVYSDSYKKLLGPGPIIKNESSLPNDVGSSGIVLTDLNRIFDEDRKQGFSIRRGPGRPAAIPKPARIKIRGFKGSDEVALEVTIHYKLSEDYGPRRQYQSWYRADFSSIEQGPHSDGLAIVKRRGFGTPADLALINSSNIPFYVVEQFETPFTWRDETPDDTLPIYKLVSGKVYSAKFTPRIRINGRKPVHGWIEHSGGSVSLSRWWIEASSPDVEIEDVKADCRPEDAEPPQAQAFTAIAVYGSNKIIMNGQIKYRLIPDYNPVAG